VRHGEVLLDESRIDLHRAWSSTTHALQRLRYNPEAADASTTVSRTPAIRA
jgi:phosphoribosylformylglycinamidine synthase